MQQEKKLITSHGFDIDDAEKYGIKAAVILFNIKHWIDHNQKTNTNFKDDRYWTYNSRSSFLEIFPYLSDKEIRLALKKLEKSNVIIMGNYNKAAYDKTKWYALTDEYLGRKGQGNLQKGQPIPDIASDIKKNLSEQDIQKDSFSSLNSKTKTQDQNLGNKEVSNLESASKPCPKKDLVTKKDDRLKYTNHKKKTITTLIKNGNLCNSTLRSCCHVPDKLTFEDTVLKAIESWDDFSRLCVEIKWVARMEENIGMVVLSSNERPFVITPWMIVKNTPIVEEFLKMSITEWELKDRLEKREQQDRAWGL